jgi:hypothetical protein
MISSSRVAVQVTRLTVRPAAHTHFIHVRCSPHRTYNHLCPPPLCVPHLSSVVRTLHLATCPAAHYRLLFVHSSAARLASHLLSLCAHRAQLLCAFLTSSCAQPLTSASFVFASSRALRCVQPLSSPHACCRLQKR